MAFFIGLIAANGLGDLGNPLSFNVEHFPPLLGQHVAGLVLNHTVQVQPGDAFTDAGLPHTQRDIALNSLPEISLQSRKANVFLHLSFMLLDDVQNHQVMLIHEGK